METRNIYLIYTFREERGGTRHVATVSSKVGNENPVFVESDYVVGLKVDNHFLHEEVGYLTVDSSK